MASRQRDTLFSKPIWDVDREILLINFFQAYRFLWDSSHGEYFCKELRNMRLQELCQTLGRDRNGNPFMENDIRSKWKNLRTTYGRELKRMERVRLLGWERCDSHWYHFARLFFLRESIKARRSDNMSTNQENHDCLDSPQEQTHSLLNVKDPTVSFAKRRRGSRFIKDLSHASPGQPHKNVGIIVAIKEEKLLDDSRHDVIPMEDIIREIGPDGRLAPITSGRLNKGFHVLPSLGNKLKTSQNNLPNGDDHRVNLAQQMVEVAQPNIKSENDAETLFGLHVACSLRRMTPYSREMAKLDIQRLFVQYAFRNQSNQQEKTLQSEIGSSCSW
uniref:uncharacterized protein isoform X1 n=1 Tax=Myxine glutinosa TaxID=7769 RepID=UPI00358EC15A